VLNFGAGLAPVQLVLGVGDHILRVFDGGVVLGQLLLQLRNFEHGDHISGLDARAVIDVELLHEAGFLGVNVDFLKGNQLGRLGERSGQ
jgi:hypothetical protein